MAKGRATGTKNRNYPPLVLIDALRVSMAIQDQASGMEVSRLTLAELLNLSPSSSNFREQVAASRFYGLTNGGINAEQFSLTSIGEKATGGDEVARSTALKNAVLNVQPYKEFLETFANKKVPGSAAFKEFLVKNAEVNESRAEECMNFILKDAETAGFLRDIKGVPYVDFSATPQRADPAEASDSEYVPEVEDVELDEEVPPSPKGKETKASSSVATKAKKVFIAHGKNRTPLEQLKKALDQFKVSYAVAVDEPNQGRPISKKVATLMKDECSSGVFIFTADEHFVKMTDQGDEEVWRPSENVVFELGAASILYENRIVIFKEKGVSFPSDFSDLGHIPFDKDQLVAELGSLFAELVALDILEVRAKG